MTNFKKDDHYLSVALSCQWILTLSNDINLVTNYIDTEIFYINSVASLKEYDTKIFGGFSMAKFFVTVIQ